jgi:non-canonical purine NTP pyrophosphatase (RdgB/HAM1 family)
MKPKLAIVTGNALKFRELSIALNDFFECEQKQLSDYHEIQGSPEEILKHKLEAAYAEFQEPVLTDDTSLHFAALNGFPGPYIRDFFRVMKPWEMGEKFAGTRIEVACRLGVCFTPGDFVFGTGIISGDVVFPKSRDDRGTEFDLFVKIDGTDRPMIEFTPEEKNKYSHRGLALKDLLDKLKKRQ